MFKRAGILGHPNRPGADGAIDQIANSLALHGIEVWTRMTWDKKMVEPLIARSDLVIAIGGDGAMLRAARVCACASTPVPVFGINTGHLGFLRDKSGRLGKILEMLASGKYWIEERMMLHAEAWRDGELLTHPDSLDALNDVVVKGLNVRSVLLELYIDEGWATTYNADGLIISTPTGSTAYALAVGGPILPPELKNILVVPVAPHLSLDRPLVLSEGATVQVTVGQDAQCEVMLTVDGENVAHLQSGDNVIVQSSTHLSRFIRLRDPNYFYRSLLDRMEPRIPVRRETNGHPQPIVTKRA